MGSTVAVTGTAGPAEWDAFVMSHPDASVYHLWAWRGIFEQVFGHRTHYLAATRGTTIAGLLPLVELRSRLFGHFLVSLPFVNYGGVIAADEEAAGALVEQARRTAQGAGAQHVELRHTTRQFPALPCRTHKVGMTRLLPSTTDEAWSSLDRKVRNQVRKAESAELQVDAGGVELLDAFYGVFAVNMRDLGTPVYSKRFFEAVLTTFPDRAACIVLRRGHVPVAAGITLTWRDRVEMPWASSLRAHRALCANMLLYWTVLQRAIIAGRGTFDFGRSSPDGGTFHFKRQWGAEPHPLYWEYCLAPGHTVPNLGTGNPAFGPAIAIWKQLPVRVASTLGPHIVRSIP